MNYAKSNNIFPKCLPELWWRVLFSLFLNPTWLKKTHHKTFYRRFLCFEFCIASRVQWWGFWADGNDQQLSAIAQPARRPALLRPLHRRWNKGRLGITLLFKDCGNHQVEQLSLGLASGHSWADCDFNEQPDCMWTKIITAIIARSLSPSSPIIAILIVVIAGGIV